MDENAVKFDGDRSAASGGPSRRHVLMSVCAGLAATSTSHARPVENVPGLPSLCDATFWTFKQTLGTGTAVLESTDNGGAYRIESADSRGMAGYLRSIKIPVDPGRRYVIKAEIRTRGLTPVTARLTGAPYAMFWDSALLPGGHQPIHGQLAPADSGWHEVVQSVIVPTTARTMEICFAFGGYGDYEDGWFPRESGRASGQLWIRNVRLQSLELIPVLPSTIHVSSPAIQKGMDVVSSCLHNAQLGGEFVVGDGYTLSGNIVPDLAFGLFGARRLAHPAYVKAFSEYWDKMASKFSPEGQAPGRVMSQILIPLGIDEIFSFTGDWKYLDHYLPLIDQSFDYTLKHADSHGLVKFIDTVKPGFPTGADWVDWYPTRMVGKTFNFHQWYVRALRRSAMLHRQMAQHQGRPGNHLDRAQGYETRAAHVEGVLRSDYWRKTYFVTNVDYMGGVADQNWMDDQLWAIRLGVATPQMKDEIWKWIDADPEHYEGTPTRWTAFSGPVHGAMTWFGRLGCGDILARYRSGNNARGYELLERISEIFVRDNNVYEAYDMMGIIDKGTKGWGNYTEHCGGYVWALSEGPFGLECDSDEQALATMTPRFPPDWTNASMDFYMRGTKLRAEFHRTGTKGTLEITGAGPAVPLRVTVPGGKSEIAQVGGNAVRKWTVPLPAKAECGKDPKAS